MKVVIELVVTGEPVYPEWPTQEELDKQHLYDALIEAADKLADAALKGSGYVNAAKKYKELREKGNV